MDEWVHGVVPLERVEERLARRRGLVGVQLRWRQRLDPGVPRAEEVLGNEIALADGVLQETGRGSVDSVGCGRGKKGSMAAAFRVRGSVWARPAGPCRRFASLQGLMLAVDTARVVRRVGGEGGPG